MSFTPKLASLPFALALAFSLLATTTVPRKSPDFIITEPSGKETPLSSFKGKVIVIEFLFLRSAHCLRVAQTLNRLHQELGPRGFQPIAIAFGPDADMQRVSYLTGDFKLTFPVGYATPDKVDSYLARDEKEILNIPQIVVIDRAGMIRAQSGAKGGDATLENENSIRSLINDLLNEQARRTPKKAASSAHRSNSVSQNLHWTPRPIDTIDRQLNGIQMTQID